MEIVTIKLPEDYARKTLIGEINSYAYYKDQSVLSYLKEFKYGENGTVEADVDNFKFDDSNDLAKCFTLSSPILSGILAIDTTNMPIDIMNKIVLDLAKFREKTPCISATAPVFNTDLSDEEHNHTQEKKEPDIQPSDIVIPIPNTPIDFGPMPMEDKDEIL